MTNELLPGVENKIWIKIDGGTQEEQLTILRAAQSLKEFDMRILGILISNQGKGRVGVIVRTECGEVKFKGDHLNFDADAMDSILGVVRCPNS